MADSTVADLDQLARKARAARQRFERDWLLNIAMFEGRQWLGFDGGRLYEPVLRDGAIRITDNRIQPAVLTQLAKLTKNRPVWTLTPTSADDADVNAAELGELVMDHMWPHLVVRKKLWKALSWSRVCCAGFLKAFWDPSLGDGVEVLHGPNGPIDGPNGQVMRPPPGLDIEALAQQLQVPLERKKINQGDVRIEVRSPFEMLPDPLADTLEECEWIIEETIKSVGYVQQRYGWDVTPDSDANPGLVDAQMRSGKQGARGVRVREFWAVPSSKYPHGKRVVWVKDQFKEDNNPFDPQPYVMFGNIDVPGRFWPTSITEQLRGPQVQLNKIKSQIAENGNRLANPTLLAPQESSGDLKDIKKAIAQPGGVVPYQASLGPAAVPSFLEPPSMPAYWLQQIERIEESIREISGQHEVTQATVPAGVTAASAINLLQEADDTRLGPAVSDMEDGLAGLGRKVLALVARYYDDTRTIRIAGENDAWEIFDFKGEMLKGNTRVDVQAGSAFPLSKAAKQAAVQSMLTLFVQQGIPLSMRNLSKALRDYDVGGLEKLISDVNDDETQVNRENRQIAQGNPLPINTYDNDQAHIDGHTEFQKGASYERQDPRVKGLFEQHVAAHRQRLNQDQIDKATVAAAGANGGQLPPAQGPDAGQQLQLVQGSQQMDHAQQAHDQRMSHAQQAHEQRMHAQAGAHNQKVDHSTADLAARMTQGGQGA